MRRRRRSVHPRRRCRRKGARYRANRATPAHRAPQARVAGCALLARACSIRLVWRSNLKTWPDIVTFLFTADKTRARQGMWFTLPREGDRSMFSACAQRSAMPRTGVPFGNCAAGNQCSTTMRLPTGVRTAPAITASRMPASSLCCDTTASHSTSTMWRACRPVAC